MNALRRAGDAPGAARVVSSMYCWSTAGSSWIRSKSATALAWGTSTKPSRSSSGLNDRALVIQTDATGEGAHGRLRFVFGDERQGVARLQGGFQM